MSSLRLVLLATVATGTAMAFAPRGAAAAGGGDTAKLVCYAEQDADAAGSKDEKRVALAVDRSSDLTFPGGLKQTVYDAHGKQTDSDSGANRRMATALGEIIVTTKGGSTIKSDFGAHMGLRSLWVRPDDVSVDYDCSTTEESATPRVWQCAIRDQNEGLKLTAATLTLMDHPDAICGFFQDGQK